MAINQLFTTTEVCNKFCQFEWLIALGRHLLLFLGGTAANDIMKEMKLLETWFNNSMCASSQALEIQWKEWYLYMHTQVSIRTQTHIRIYTYL